jgi:hypothetical protein
LYIARVTVSLSSLWHPELVRCSAVRKRDRRARIDAKNLPYLGFIFLVSGIMEFLVEGTVQCIVHMPKEGIAI